MNTPPRNPPNGEWKTPKRAEVRALYATGLYTQEEFKERTGVPQQSVSQIVRFSGPRRARSTRTGRPRILTKHEVRRLIGCLQKGWKGRRLSYKQLATKCGIRASEATIRRPLKEKGYRRCIACPRPFINKKQQKKRYMFAKRYKNWTSEWNDVVWSDECSFEVRERGRLWVTRRPSEQYCQHCLKSTYRSGRTSVMVWDALGWGFKSPLVFLEREEGAKGITSKAYLHQVLEPIIFNMLDGCEQEFIFMEDGAKIYKGVAKLPKISKGIRTFDWPPSSPDLNPIEKVWRWMKFRLSQMETFPTTVNELKGVLQSLWDELDPTTFLPEIERMPQKVKEVIKQRGMATKY